MCTRADLVESRHRVHAVVVDAHGSVVLEAGDADQMVNFRSAAKPFQALPLVEDGVVERYGLTPAQLALCCASHSGQARHVEVARAILLRAGADEDALECGPHDPFDVESAGAILRAGDKATPIHNNCSGKHAGMLALALAHGWATKGYRLPEHPLQRRMHAEVARWTAMEADAVATGLDGCGVVCFAVPLAAMARSYARFTAAADAGEAAGTIVAAMTAHPFLVGGSERLCTDLMERAGDRVFAKTGAEGVYCAGVRGRGVGIALKVEDGGTRASGVVLLELLRRLDVLDEADLDALRRHAAPVLRNTRGEAVGRVRLE